MKQRPPRQPDYRGRTQKKNDGGDHDSPSSRPNARHEPLPEAGARDERTLEAVGSMPLFGQRLRLECFMHCPLQ
jgi:hypothetical protein